MDWAAAELHMYTCINLCIDYLVAVGRRRVNGQCGLAVYRPCKRNAAIERSSERASERERERKRERERERESERELNTGIYVKSGKSVFTSYEDAILSRQVH